MAGKVKSLEAVEESLQEAAAFQERNPFSQFTFADETEVSVKPTATKQDPTEFRRGRMVEAIDVQMNLWRDPNWTTTRTVYREVPGEERRKGVEETYIPRKWFTRSRTGKVTVECRYGNRPFEVIEGKKYAVLEEAQVEPFFQTLRAEVLKGTFDDQIARLATRAYKDK